MKLKLNILQKILLYILLPAVVLLLMITFLVNRSGARNVQDASMELVDTYAQLHASEMEQWVGEAFTITRTLAASCREYKHMPYEQWRIVFRDMFVHVLRTTSQIDAIWDSWMCNRVNPAWDGAATGRYFFSATKQSNGRINRKEGTYGLDGESEQFRRVREHEREYMMEPYLSEAYNELMTSVICPIRDDGFVGLVSSDFLLRTLQQEVEAIRPFEHSQAFLVSQQGFVLAHRDTALSGKRLDIVGMATMGLTDDHMKRMQLGHSFSFTYDNALGQPVYCTVRPIKLGASGEFWALGITTPHADILAKSNRDFLRMLIVSLLGVGLLIVLAVTMTYTITRPLKRITSNLQSLSQGQVNRDMMCSIDRADEMDTMMDAFSKSISGIMEKTEFAQRIGRGELGSELNLLSADDVLGRSLLEMRDNLRTSQAEAEARQAEEAKKHWINNGITQFAGLMRQHNDDLTLLCDDIIKNLVWYLKASVGGIFMANNDADTSGTITYDLVSTFAYDRKRFEHKSYECAEGLVGACAAERDVILLTEIPDGYIEITSGLGDTPPNSLLLMPLVADSGVLGVIEIASLRAFEPHEVEFVREVSKSITATLNTVKVNALTKHLFEQSKEQAERMREQEEEMRQNFEELQATQEEAARKTYELEGLVNALNSSLYVMEYDVNGVCISVNDAYLRTLCAKREDIVGTHHLENISLSTMARTSYEQFWNELLEGQIKKRKTRVKIEDTERVLLETYTAIRNEQGEVYKVLKIATDVTNI